MPKKDEPATGDDNTSQNDDLEKMKEALHKANEEAKKYRLQVQEKEQALEKLQADSDSSKSEMDKVAEKLAALEKRAEESDARALRAEIANAKKLTPAQAKRLQGSTREELEADADELLEAFGGGSNDDASASNGNGAKPSSTGRPKENLRPGAANENTEAEIDSEKADKLAASIEAAGFM